MVYSSVNGDEAPLMPGPLVSIGLPVRNGERFVGEAISSLLGQSHRNLELIISDNASTDRTQGICTEFGEADTRVRYFRQPTNIGGPANWNFVVREARGEYFKWASANDICDPAFVERCLTVLEDDPGSVLCYPRTAFIDGQGEIKEKYEADFEVLHPTPFDRFRHLVRRGGLNNAHQGLIRTSILRKTGLERNFEGGDHPLMAELAIGGKWRLVPEYLLFRRMNDGTHTARLSTEEKRERFYSQASRFRMPFLRIYLEYLRIGCRAGGMPLRQRAKALSYLLRVGWWNRSRIVKDLCGVLRSEGDR